jgi:hypothetical protein
MKLNFELQINKNGAKRLVTVLFGLVSFATGLSLLMQSTEFHDTLLSADSRASRQNVNVKKICEVFNSGLADRGLVLDLEIKYPAAKQDLNVFDISSDNLGLNIRADSEDVFFALGEDSSEKYLISKSKSDVNQQKSSSVFLTLSLYFERTEKPGQILVSTILSQDYSTLTGIVIPLRSLNRNCETVGILGDDAEGFEVMATARFLPGSDEKHLVTITGFIRSLPAWAGLVLVTWLTIKRKSNTVRSIRTQ